MDVHRGDDEMPVVMLEVGQAFLNVVLMVIVKERDRAHDFAPAQATLSSIKRLRIMSATSRDLFLWEVLRTSESKRLSSTG